MARLCKNRSFEPVISAAQKWVQNSLVADKSLFSSDTLWTLENLANARNAIGENPDEGEGDFATNLKTLLESASASAKRLMAEMLWAHLLFPSNIKAATKRQQIGDI